jgi:hypothetical protein
LAGFPNLEAQFDTAAEHRSSDNPVLGLLGHGACSCPTNVLLVNIFYAAIGNYSTIDNQLIGCIRDSMISEAVGRISKTVHNALLPTVEERWPSSHILF